MVAGQPAQDAARHDKSATAMLEVETPGALLLVA